MLIVYKQLDDYRIFLKSLKPRLQYFSVAQTLGIYPINADRYPKKETGLKVNGKTPSVERDLGAFELRKTGKCVRTNMN